MRMFFTQYICIATSEKALIFAFQKSGVLRLPVKVWLHKFQGQIRPVSGLLSLLKLQ